MRIMRDSPERPFYAIGLLAVAGRTALMASVWILLMARFDVSPMTSAATSIALQGTIIFSQPLSKKIFLHMTVLSSQRLGAGVGIISSSALLFIDNLAIFIAVAFIASTSKVALESTFPRITHSYTANDPKFASRFVGAKESGYLCASAIIAPIALSGFMVAPMVIAISIFIVVYAFTFLFPECGMDSYEEVLNADSTQERFDRRIGDIERNESIRENQSRIHKLRRIPSTLLLIVLFQNLVCGGSMALMALCLAQVSSLSQGVEPALGIIFGVSASFVGIIVMTWIRNNFKLSDGYEWGLLIFSYMLVMVSVILYTTIAGLYVAIIAAFFNGLSWAMCDSLLSQRAAQVLSVNEYHKFGCSMMQRDALGRIVAPLIVGAVATWTSLHGAFIFIGICALVFTLIISLRVILIMYGQQRDRILIVSSTSSPCRAQQTHPLRYERGTLAHTNMQSSQHDERQSVYERAQSPPHYGLSFRYIKSRLTITSTQKD